MDRDDRTEYSVFLYNCSAIFFRMLLFPILISIGNIRLDRRKEHDIPSIPVCGDYHL